VRNGTDLRFVIDATKDALKTAPSYEDTAGRVHLTPDLTPDLTLTLAPSTKR